MIKYIFARLMSSVIFWNWLLMRYNIDITRPLEFELTLESVMN